MSINFDSRGREVMVRLLFPSLWRFEGRVETVEGERKGGVEWTAEPHAGFFKWGLKGFLRVRVCVQVHVTSIGVQ